MSCFTVAIDEEERRIQFKCGWDCQEEYRVGEDVNWRINGSEAGEGYLLDGAYDGVYEKSELLEQCWVIISGHKVVAIEPWNEEQAYDDEQRLMEKWGITDLPRETWPTKAWRIKERQDALADERKAKLDEDMGGATTPEQVYQALAKPLEVSVNYREVAKGMLGGSVKYCPFCRQEVIEFVENGGDEMCKECSDWFDGKNGGKE